MKPAAFRIREWHILGICYVVILTEQRRIIVRVASKPCVVARARSSSVGEPEARELPQL